MGNKIGQLSTQGTIR